MHTYALMPDSCPKPNESEFLTLEPGHQNFLILPGSFKGTSRFENCLEDTAGSLAHGSNPLVANG
jgi:hypothetical protein